jgi:hypothetical protein
MKLTGAAILVSRGMTVLQAAPAAYPYRSAERRSLMDEVPRQLLDGLSPEESEKVAVWWAQLTDAAQAEVAYLCDPLREECFFGVISEDAAAQVPVVIGGRFVPRDDVAGWEEWHAELFGHLLCNPELVVFAPPVVRTFHICTRHEAARAALAVGRIPVDFRCPLSLEECPMRQLLSVAPNNSLQQTGAALRLFAVYCHSSGPGG